METLGVIPARFGATRFDGKLLQDLGGKPVIQHVYERAKKARTLDRLVVAADDERIVQAVEAFGGQAMLTSRAHATGTDRLAEAANAHDARIIVNIQGDEPFISPLVIEDLIRAMQSPDAPVMATAAKKSRSAEEFASPDVVKLVMDDSRHALYFSRAPIPSRLSFADKNEFFYKHIGLYAYTKDFLFTFKNLPPSFLERHERLEQLRALENGYRIRVIETELETVGIDTPADLERARHILEKEKHA